MLGGANIYRGRCRTLKHRGGDAEGGVEGGGVGSMVGGLLMFKGIKRNKGITC